jgi:O-antigen/teichoic acid export membrane protein
MLKHLGVMGLARGLYAVSQAVLLILLARDVGPHGFGIVASFIAAHGVLFWLAGMNTPTFVTREIALGEFARAVASIRLNAVVMAVAIVLALASSVLLVAQPLLLLAVAGNAFGIWSERVTDNRLGVAYGEKRIRSPVVTLIVRSLVPLVLYLGLVVLGVQALIAFAVARVVGGLASQFLGLLLIRLPSPVLATSTRDVLRAQAPLATSQTMNAIRTLDSVIVIALAGAAVSGIYSAVSRVVSPFNTLAVSAAPVVVPRAALASSARVIRMLDCLLLVGMAASAITLVLIPFTESVVVFVFGPKFAGGGPVLLWVLLRVGPVAATPLILTALQAKGFDRLAALNSTATSVLTLAAVAVGAIIGGATGAAAGFAVVSLFGMIALWLSGRQSLASKPDLRSF